jgi:hypothetical protein
MQQLTLQFEGYADSRQPETQGTARQCQRGVFYEAFQHFLESLRKSVTKPSVKKSVALWWAAPSGTFSALCATDRSDVFTHGDVVMAHLALAAVLALVGIGGAL